MVSIIHAVGFLLGCYFLLRSYVLIREKKEEVLDFLVWGGVGVSILVLSLVPQAGDTLAQYLNTRTTANTIFALAIFLLYVIIFRIHTLNRDLDRNISALNEEIALLKHRLEQQPEN
jgi:hypothetical protein